MGNRKNRPSRQYGYKNRKDDRDYVAIVSKSKLLGIWTGDESTSKIIAAPNDRDTRLGAFRLFDEVLDKIPTNDDLLDKQVAIYGLDILVNAILRPGDVVRNGDITEEVQEMLEPMREKYFDRNYNCFLVSEKGSEASIVKEGFDWLQETAERKAAAAFGVSYEKQNFGTTTTGPRELSPMEKLQVKYNDIMDKKLELLMDPVGNEKQIAAYDAALNQIERMLKGSSSSVPVESEEVEAQA